MKKLITTLLLATGLMTAAAANATIIFSDNFDTDTTATTLNFSSLNNWNVTDGTVDYIKQGGYGISCAGGTGGCIDLDGSTYNGGTMVSKTVFDFLAGVSYTLEVDVSGNQRGGAADDFAMGLYGIFGNTYSNILYNQAFQTYSINFSPIVDYSASLFITTSSNDNIGVIVDNVRLSSDQVGVPEPSSLMLMGAGLIGLSFARRKRAIK